MLPLPLPMPPSATSEVAKSLWYFTSRSCFIRAKSQPLSSNRQLIRPHWTRCLREKPGSLAQWPSEPVFPAELVREARFVSRRYRGPPHFLCVLSLSQDHGSLLVLTFTTFPN